MGQRTSGDYAVAWKKVEDLLKAGQPQSALTEVNRIYERAKKDKLEAQLVKAVVYRLNLQEEVSDNEPAVSLKALHKEVEASSGPVRSVLLSLEAGLYYNYYASLRWKLMSATRVEARRPDDPSTWSIEDFHEQIVRLYTESIANEKLLRETDLTRMDPLLVKGNMRKLRPTLYDLLVHRALDYFKNDEFALRRPAYAFEISQEAAFAPAGEFVKTTFSTADSLSREHKALLLYQRLLKFHLHDTDPSALIDADLQRIGYVYNKSVHPDKQKLYYQALEGLAARFPDHAGAAQARFLMAQWHFDNAQKYSPYGDTTQRFEAVRAAAICEQVVKQYPDSEGGVNAHNLLLLIRQPSLSFEIEKVNIPAQPFRVSVVFKNVPEVAFRLVKITETLTGLEEQIGNDQFWKTLLAQPATKAWKQLLNDSRDFQPHRTELKVEALPAGTYFLVAAAGPKVEAAAGILGARLFHVSAIGFVNERNNYFVFDRNSGKPLAGAAVQTWDWIYNNRTYKQEKHKGRLYHTDANGFFRLDTLAKNEAGRMFGLEISHDGDRLFMNERLYGYYPREKGKGDLGKENRTVFFFTDRGIYRPGQTLYFKGILLSGRNSEVKKPLPGEKMVIRLKDANGQVADSVEITTSSYGSVAGKFSLPAAGLNGQFSLEAGNADGNAFFNVEDYKRPRFRVELDTLNVAFKVNDTIRLTGNARAYAGNALDGVKVKYRVERVPRFIYPWRFAAKWLPAASPMEIAHGETETDVNGVFSLKFKALPDLTISPDLDPVFDYRVYAEVTDSNGETRTAEQQVSVSYKSLLLKIEVPERLDKDSLEKIAVRTENLAGKFVPATVRLTVKRLLPEQRLLRTRYWERPDVFTLTKAEYIRDFPHDIYDNEDKPESWQAGEELFSYEKKTNAAGSWPWQGPLESGFYTMEFVTRDAEGNEVKAVKNVELTTGNAAPGRPVYLWVRNEGPATPGKEAVFTVGTSADEVFLINAVRKRNEKDAFRFEKMARGTHTFGYPVKEADRGGYGIGFLFVKHNRVHEFQDVIQVPWEGKELKIRYGSFRDKTLPGSKETWTLSITGDKKEKVAAEVLASMYDASLDQFLWHQWRKPAVWPVFSGPFQWNSRSNFYNDYSLGKNSDIYGKYRQFKKQYDELIAFSFQQETRFMLRGASRQEKRSMSADAQAAPVALEATSQAKKAEVGFGNVNAEETDAPEKKPEGGQIRKNFNETAFFYPDLRTDKDGTVTFSFTMPEALTQWKFQALAHTETAAFGYSTQEIVTRKELMVQPNVPRFIRAGDTMALNAKIVNLSDRELSGTVVLSLLNAETNKPMDAELKNEKANQAFRIPAGQSRTVHFPVSVPQDLLEPVVVRIVATAAEFNDGEENILPVLTNRMLVTESLPLAVKGEGSRTYRFEKLLGSGASRTLKHQGLTLEYTANPAWYAIQALPYLMEYPYECAEQIWNRYYANTLAATVANSNPKIAAVFERWKNSDSTALMSNLQKNPELKSFLLEETPWVMAAKDEATQKKNIALLFDLVRMKNESAATLEKLKQQQLETGAYPWFKGGPEHRYVSQYILTGIGHLRKLAEIDKKQDAELTAITDRLLGFVDARIAEDYKMLEAGKGNMKTYVPGPIVIQYLYMRSFFRSVPVPPATRKAYDYFLSQTKKNWVGLNKYLQAMTALTAWRNGDKSTAAAILRSLKETAIRNPELGTYWKSARRSWWWQEAPIEQHALLVEAFEEAGNDTAIADEIRTWLLLNKQTNRWESTKATAEACYALLLRGNSWLADEPKVTITLGDRTFDNEKAAEAGSGYFKASLPGDVVSPSDGQVKVTVAPTSGKTGARPSWGGVYWQYFEDLDKITFAETPLKLKKQLYLEENTDRGPVLKPLGKDARPGDRIKVRIELSVDRDMEFVQMKDMRAAGLEPVNVLSSYKWQGGLGYYESTRDASTSFFFHYLPKGRYVFEYPLHVTHPGDFSNGITTIQCMYAPEFTAHSEGVRLHVKP